MGARPRIYRWKFWGVYTEPRAKIAIDARETGILGRHVLCALSGGADSVALLLLLCRLREKGEISLTAAHFEHGIRAGASVEDMRFARGLCEKLRVPLAVGRASVPEEAKKTGEGLESCARRLRYAFLREEMARAGADVIALAHHMDDQAETVLMHLLRGGGPRGAGGMRAREGDLARPLLRFQKHQLTEFLLSEGQTWREDETNRDLSSPRNLLRNRAMPALLCAYPGGARALSRFAEIMQSEDAYMESAAARAWEARVSVFAGVVRVKLSPPEDTAILRRLVRRALPDLSFEDLERARAAKERAQLPGGAYAQTVGDTLYLSPKLPTPCPVPVPEGGTRALPGVCVLRVEEAPSAADTRGGFSQVLDARALQGSALRLRAPGDFICPLGMGGQKKLLSDCFTDKKIPRPLRDRLPLLCRGSEVLWACGAMVSETAKVCGARPARRFTIQIDESTGGEYHA